MQGQKLHTLERALLLPNKSINVTTFGTIRTIVETIAIRITRLVIGEEFADAAIMRNKYKAILSTTQHAIAYAAVRRNEGVLAQNLAFMFSNIIKV